MKLYGVHEGLYEGVQARIDSLRSACAELGVEYLDIDSLTFDYSVVPKLGRHDLLYCLSRGAETLMSLLINDDVTTFYRRNPDLNLITSSTTEWSIVHEKRGLNAPKTIFSLTADRALLKRYVEYLGGFPIVLKVVGGTRGIGTIKSESWHSLFSMADYLVEIGARFILRQFIEADFGARALVIGEGVVASSRFFFQENDFRNAPILAKTTYEPHQLDSVSERLCIAAVEDIGLELGGVDLLYDKGGVPYLLEVNFPVGFQSFQERGPAIVNAMVSHLAWISTARN
jgi:hypothetical protein